MPELEYFVAAESTSVDRDTNAISIFNVFNERRFQQFPLTLKKMVLVTCWISSPEELRDKPALQADIVISLDGVRAEGPFRANFECDSEFQHIIFNVTDAEIPGPCLMEIELRVNGDHKARHRIRFIES